MWGEHKHCKVTVKKLIFNIVFTKNKLADLSILFIVLLPSATILGIELKLESKRTSLENDKLVNVKDTNYFLDADYFIISIGEDI